MAILTLRKGSKGSAVSIYQENLGKLGFGTKVDGVFGEDTKLKTISFQKAYGLVADGIAGQATQTKLIQVLKEKFPISSGIQSIISSIGNKPTATYTPPKTSTPTATNPPVKKEPVYQIIPEEKPKQEESGMGGMLLYGLVVIGGLWGVSKLNAGTMKKGRR